MERLPQVIAVGIATYCGGVEARPTRELRKGGRRTAFTLVELVVVCAILVIFAGLIAPNVAKMRDNQIIRDAVPSAERLIGYARESAISKKATVVLSYDSSTRTLTAKQDTTVDSNAVTVSPNSASNGAGSAPLPLQTGAAAVQLPTAPQTPDANNPIVNKSVTLPQGVDATTFQIAGKQVSEGDFQLHFYTDGTCDSGGISFTIGTNIQSLQIDDFGRINEVLGDLPDPTTQKWEAGAFEPRQNATQ